MRSSLAVLEGRSFTAGASSFRKDSGGQPLGGFVRPRSEGPRGSNRVRCRLYVVHQPDLQPPAGQQAEGVAVAAEER